MTASADPDTYGRLTSYVLPGLDDLRTDRCASSAKPSRPPTCRSGSTGTTTRTTTRAVRFGDLQLVPIADGLLWVRPYYVAIEGSESTPPSTEYRYVIVSHNAQSSFGRTLQEALAGIFPEFDTDIGDLRTDIDDPLPDDIDSDDDPSPGDSETDDDTPEPTDTRPPLGDDADAAALLAEADALFDDADQYLRDGDLAGYQAAVDEASDLVAQAIELIEQG